MTIKAKASNPRPRTNIPASCHQQGMQSVRPCSLQYCHTGYCSNEAFSGPDEPGFIAALFTQPVLLLGRLKINCIFNLRVMLDMSCYLLQYLAGSGALNGIGGSSPQLSEHDANNSDTLVAGVRDSPSASQAGNSVSLDAASTGSSPLSAGGAPRRRDKKSANVRLLWFWCSKPFWNTRYWTRMWSTA